MSVDEVLITPLILWLTSKNSVVSMDEHGKTILNLQLSLLLYIVLSIPTILLLEQIMGKNPATI